MPCRQPVSQHGCGSSALTSAGISTYVVGKVVQEHLATGGSVLDLQLSKAKAKVALEMSKIKAKSGEVAGGIKTKLGEGVGEGKLRVENAIAALRGKKLTSPAVEEHVGVAG